MKKAIKFSEDLTPWEAWIIRFEKSHNVISNNYDKICNLAVHQYDLHVESRKQDHQDRITFFCRWWFENKKFMKKYNSYASIGYILGKKDHASVMHHVKGRVVSYGYEENVACIKDFLES